MSSHNTITTLEDSVSETLRGVTEYNDSVSSEQPYLAEAFKPVERRIKQEKITDLGDGYAVRSSGENYVIISPEAKVIFPYIIFRRLIAYHVPLIAGEKA